MKINSIINKTLLMLAVGASVASCDDYLDKEPPSYLVPEDYYKDETHIQAVANRFYTETLPSHGGQYGTFQSDANTDNQARGGSDGKYAVGSWKVADNNGSYSWGGIYDINTQLQRCLDQYNKGAIAGNDVNIRHYIGELYFFRALRYFNMYQAIGDLPIVKEPLPDDEAVLVAASKRAPRNEVARFILEDLDNALLYMKENFESRHTRISTDVVHLLKSRVALFEGSWLTNFANTPFVPQGEGWPGRQKDYNKDYQYPEGSIENEARWFFEQSAREAEIVADRYIGSLVVNTGVIPQKAGDPVNPYFRMFGNIDMTEFPEVLLWREYSSSLGIRNSIETAVERNNYACGPTRSLVEGFVMADGKPIYASSYTDSDATIHDVRANRDPRLTVFLKEPGQINCFLNMDDTQGTMYVTEEGYPDIVNGADDKLYFTGYALRKGGMFDKELAGNHTGWTASITYRATEALLNYIEAQYMIGKSISSGKILEYWKKIRECAGFTGDAVNPMTTINATVIEKEKLDWGAYTAGQLLTDPVLYNIRRERRCELMAEGLRWFDLIRWRSLDQLKNTPYHVEGFHLWNTPMTSWYDIKPEDYNGSATAYVSSPELSEYFRVYQKDKNGRFYNGYTWRMAHYLQPMPLKQLRLTAPDHKTLEQSPLYQNPYWPLVADMPAEQ